MPHTDIAGIILAGGKSSRMGKDKATLPWKGARLVDVVAGILREAGIADVYVSGAVEGYANIIDLLPDKGPVGGICACVQDLQSLYAGLLFVPVDMPLLSVLSIGALLEQEGEYDACHYEDRPLPCFFRLNERTMSYAHYVQTKIAGGATYAVKRLLAGLSTASLPVSNTTKDSLINTNTPQEWREATHESAHQ